MEIDSLIVRLIGDNTALVKTLQDAAKEHDALLATVQVETKQMVDAHRAAGVHISKEIEDTIITLQKMSVALDTVHSLGGMTAKEHAEATAKLNLEVKAVTDVIAKAAAEQLEWKKKGEDATNKHRTAQEIFNDVEKEHQILLQKGLIVQETYNRAMLKATEELNKSKVSVASFSQKMAGYANTMIYFGGALAGLFGLTVRQGINAAAQYETTVASFKTMIGSLDETQKTMKRLSEFAVEAPMSMPQIEQAAMGLIQFGERGDEMIDTLKILGNAAAGTGTHFNLLSSVFNQVRGVGHLLTGDFRQLSTRGVLSLQDIAKHFKVTENEAGKMLSTGKVSFLSFKKILEGLSEEGGRFHNMMADQSKTFEGQMAKMKDALNIAIRDIGQKFMPIAKAILDTANKILDYWKDVPDLFKTIAATVMGLTFAVGTSLVGLGGWIKVIPKVTEFWKDLNKILWFNNLVCKAGEIAFYKLELQAIKTAAASAAAWVAAMGPVGWVIVGAVAAVSVAMTVLYKQQSDRLAKLRAETAATIAEIDKLTEKDKKNIEKDLKGGQLNVDKATTGAKKEVALEKEMQVIQDQLNAIQEKKNKLKEALAQNELDDKSHWFENRDIVGDPRADAAKEIANKIIASDEEKQKLLANKRELYEEELAQIKKNGGVTDEQLDQQEKIKTGLEDQLKSLKNVHEFQKGKNMRLFDPEGLKKDFLALEKLKEDKFKPEVIEAQDALQKNIRKNNANNELTDTVNGLMFEKELIGLTNKELQVKKYTAEGLSELKAKELADLQFNVGLLKELNALEEKNRNIGLTPHQARKAKAEREGADSEGMKLIDGIRDKENQGTIKSMEAELELLGHTAEEIQIINMRKDKSNEKDIKAVELLQELTKERRKMDAITNSFRDQNESLPATIAMLKLQTKDVNQQTTQWEYQKKMQQDILDIEIQRGTVPNHILDQNKALREQETQLLKVKELMEFSQGVKESLKSPEDKLKEELAKYQAAIGNGLTEDQAAEASARAIDANLKSTVNSRPENSGTVVGSREYARKERERDGGMETKQEKLLKAQTLLQGAGNAIQQNILTRLDKMGSLAMARS